MFSTAAVPAPETLYMPVTAIQHQHIHTQQGESWGVFK